MRLFGGKLRKASHNYRRNGGYGGGRCEIGGGKVLWGVNAYAQSMLWSSVLKTVGAVLFGRNVRHSERAFSGTEYDSRRLAAWGTGVLQAKNEQLNLI